MNVTCIFSAIYFITSFLALSPSSDSLLSPSFGSLEILLLQNQVAAADSVVSPLLLLLSLNSSLLPLSSLDVSEIVEQSRLAFTSDGSS